MPTLFLVQSFIFYYKARNWYGELPQANVIMNPGLAPGENEYSLLVFRVSNVLLSLTVAGFVFLFICSLLSYFLWRKQLSQKHFILQSLCYLPFLVLVILQHVPAGNPVNWFIGYLGQ